MREDVAAAAKRVGAMGGSREAFSKNFEKSTGVSDIRADVPFYSTFGHDESKKQKGV